MSRLPEQRLWDRLRKAAAGRVYTERVENLVGVGRPDIDTLVNGRFVPVELKAVARWPAKATTPVLGRKGVSQQQANWHLNWRRWRGRSLIVVGVGDEVYAFCGTVADDLNRYDTGEFRAAAVATGLVAIIDLLVRDSEKASL